MVQPVNASYASPGLTLQERLLRNHYIDNNGCWIWTGGAYKLTSSTGVPLPWMQQYGSMTVKGRGAVATHRLAYELWVAPPGKMCVMHRCDVPRCFNPDHLELGTRQDNNADRTRKGRQARGERHGSYRVTPEMLEEIVKLNEEGWSSYRIAAKLGIGKTTVLRKLKEINQTTDVDAL